MMWRKDSIRTYLERDIPEFGPRVPAETLERLWTMLGHNQGGILNASQLAAAMMISAQSTTRYIDLMVNLLLVRRLQPFHPNVGKRIVKSPKVYVRVLCDRESAGGRAAIDDPEFLSNRRWSGDRFVTGGAWARHMYPIGQGVEAIGLEAMASMLAEL